MKIGILGAGNIGGTLGKLWSARGHEVYFAVRDSNSEKAQALLQASPNAQVGTIEEAVNFGTVVLLSVHWRNVPEVLEAIQGKIDGKVLIDATNRVTPPPADTAGSAAEDIAKAVPNTKVVKSFNTLGANSLTQLKFGSHNASNFICGDDTQAKSVVSKLAAEIGFDVVDVGALATARLVESLAMLWVQASRNYGRDIAFRLLRR